jgi:phage gpG-like protein
MARRFKDLASALRKLSAVPAQTARGAADRISAQVQQDFDAGVDPYGDPWEPLAETTLEKGREPPPLTDTGAMRASVDVRPGQGAGITFTIDDPAIHHQYGTVHMPQRAIFPNRPDLPDTWRRAISDASEEAFTKQLSSLGVFGE